MNLRTHIFQRAVIELTRGGLPPANDQLGITSVESADKVFPDATPLEEITSGDTAAKQTYIFGLLEAAGYSLQYALQNTTTRYIRVTLPFPRTLKETHMGIFLDAKLSDLGEAKVIDKYPDLLMIQGTLDSEDYKPLAPCGSREKVVEKVFAERELFITSWCKDRGLDEQYAENYDRAAEAWASKMSKVQNNPNHE
jgi:hypothetical protein